MRQSVVTSCVLLATRPGAPEIERADLMPSVADYAAIEALKRADTENRKQISVFEEV
jgi:hypothetical protein